MEHFRCVINCLICIWNCVVYFALLQISLHENNFFHNVHRQLPYLICEHLLLMGI